MSRNPIINALAASSYIILVVLVMNLATQPFRNKPDTFFRRPLNNAICTYTFCSDNGFPIFLSTCNTLY